MVFCTFAFAAVFSFIQRLFFWFFLAGVGSYPRLVFLGYAPKLLLWFVWSSNECAFIGKKKILPTLESTQFQEYR